MRVTFNGDRARRPSNGTCRASASVSSAQGPEGAVYLLEDGDGGRLLRLTPAAR